MHQIQRVTATPLNIFQHRHNLEVQAFPTLYPDGMNGFVGLVLPEQTRFRPWSMYFQVRMLSSDSRWPPLGRMTIFMKTVAFDMRCSSKVFSPLNAKGTLATFITLNWDVAGIFFCCKTIAAQHYHPKIS